MALPLCTCRSQKNFPAIVNPTLALRAERTLVTDRGIRKTLAAALQQAWLGGWGELLPAAIHSNGACNRRNREFHLVLQHTSTLPRWGDGLVLSVSSHPIRDALHHAAAIHAGKRAGALGEEFLAAEQFVRVFHLRGGNLGDRRAQPQEVVVARREAIFHLHLDDHHQQPRGFHFSITETAGAEELDAAHLEIGEIVGVMQHAHRVGFLVTDADLDFVLRRQFRHECGRWSASWRSLL